MKLFSKTRFSEAQSKSYSLQLLRGLAFIHSQNIIHRDLKPSNLLISPTRRLKIADFGLARLQDDVRPMSHQVATRWYRAPELLYGARRYNYAVDMWSAGTIIGELLTFSPLFPGHSGSISRFFGKCARDSRVPSSLESPVLEISIRHRTIVVCYTDSRNTNRRDMAAIALIT